MGRQMVGFGAALWLVFLPAAAGAGADELTLKVRYEPGKVVYFEQIEKIDQKFDMGQGEPMAMKMDSLYCLKQTVKSVEGGKAQVAFSYDRFAMSIDSAMMPPMKYDSDGKNEEDEAEQIEMIFKPMLGETVTVQVGPGGRADSASGLAAIVEKVEKEAAGNMLWGQMKDSLTDASFKAQMIDRQAAMLPEKPVKVGDEWKGTVRIDSGPIGTLVVDFACTLKSVGSEGGRKVAVIEFESKMSVAPDSKPTSGPAAQMNIKLDNGGGKGKAWFDVDAGSFVKVESENSMDMSMEMNTMKMSMKQKMDSTLRWLSEKEREEQRKAGKQAATEAKKDAKTDK
ncbi:MAG: hypothetical protein IT450_03345 [Phycisphaerales bacterium]|nr:hypothetical protein [Phycisphaerales bacterium]